jgi:hypothetical protein
MRRSQLKTLWESKGVSGVAAYLWMSNPEMSLQEVQDLADNMCGLLNHGDSDV